MKYHPHIHSVISGGCLSPDKTKIMIRGNGFFLPVHVVSKKFRGKFLFYLKTYREAGILKYGCKCDSLRNSYEWKDFVNRLYEKDWVFYIKETFNHFGNAIKYLGNYTHRVAISNQRIKSVDDSGVVFTVKDYKNGDYSKDVFLTLDEFLSRMMLHVLPRRFQKIRYYGFLNNRYKNANLKTIFKLQGKQRSRAHFRGLSKPEIIRLAFGKNLLICPCCGKESFMPAGRTFPLRE